MSDEGKRKIEELGFGIASLALEQNKRAPISTLAACVLITGTTEMWEWCDRQS